MNGSNKYSCITRFKLYNDQQLTTLREEMMKTIEGYTYKVNEHIGKGYSSTVHKGINDKNGEDVSIKVIEMAKLEDPINQMLLQLEITALKALSASRYVLHIYDVYATRNNTYIITELCEGDFAQMLKLRKNIPFYQAVEILRQLVCGYTDVHKAGFIHRDIKPANIFHKNGVYKFGDFGFAIPITEISQHKNYNVGSPVYMPPEALKENVYSISCDTWAIGVMFYQMLKGVVPWRAISEQVLFDKIMNQSIDGLTVGLPDIARKFLSQVLCLDPKNRLTPQQLATWPAQLSSAPLQIQRSMSPLDFSARSNQALKQIKNLSLGGNKISSTNIFQVKQIISPNNENSKPSFIKQKQLKELNRMKKETCEISQENEYKESYFFASNSIHFIRFLHRSIKFVGDPTPLHLQELESLLVGYLFKQIQIFKRYIELKEENNVERWGQFIASFKGQMIKKKCLNYETKYKMFHKIGVTTVYEGLNQQIIQSSISQIIAFLQKEDNFDSKLVIAADYLTTLFQLLHLKGKYQVKQFMKISKIDLIMQGNPYNASPQHFEKLKKKITLINI